MNDLQFPVEDHSDVLDVCRRAMLMESIANEFNLLPMRGPVQRVKDVALVLVGVANEHDLIRTIVEEKSVMTQLQAIGRARRGCEIELPTLLEDLPRQVEGRG